MTVALNHRITGEGPPLILLHGLFGSLDNLGGIARRLEDQWQIHALDERNHGSSPHTDTMDYPAMAADVIAYMDAQVGKVLDALDAAGIADETIIIFTSDHGYHLGEHDFWAKVSLHEESAAVPLIISVPGKKPAVCDSLVELMDLFPTTARLCGLGVPERLQGKDISPMLDDPEADVREAAFCVSPMQRGFLLRTEDWAYMQYGEDGKRGAELFDMTEDPKQYVNLVGKPEHAERVAAFERKMAAKLKELRTNDL